MNILHLASIIVFVILVVFSGNKFLEVRDNKLGYEEIILFTSAIYAAMNVLIGLFSLCYDLPEIMNYLIISSQLFSSLLILAIAEFISKIHPHRLENKKE